MVNEVHLFQYNEVKYNNNKKEEKFKKLNKLYYIIENALFAKFVLQI